MGTDLLRQQQKWKDGLMEIRQIMAKLVEKVCIHYTPVSVVCSHIIANIFIICVHRYDEILHQIVHQIIDQIVDQFVDEIVDQVLCARFFKGFAADNMKMWKAHWDRQLYKALEHQYQMGLEALNENLPEIKVELTYA